MCRKAKERLLTGFLFSFLLSQLSIQPPPSSAPSMPKARKSPIDRFTNASASAVSAGFSAALAFGTQPIIDPNKNIKGSTSTSNLGNSNPNQAPIFTHYDPNNNLFSGAGGLEEEEEEDEEGDAQSPLEVSEMTGEE